MSEEVKLPITKDGGLYDLGWYLAWEHGDDDAVLDGRFTPADLRAIADHIDKTNALASLDGRGK